MLFGMWWLRPLFLVAPFMAFFRDPRRNSKRTRHHHCSADGRVTLVGRGEPEMGSESLVSIFLSPLDVHVNRAPIAGKITAIQYKKGKFLMATDERSRDVNEQNTLTLEGDNIRVKCSQIAGILARRIVCWKREGDRVELGERFGMIKFSSRTDVLLPSVSRSSSKKACAGGRRL